MIPGQNPDAKVDVEVARRPSIKMPPGPPHIVVCMPIGAKDEELIFDMPKCSKEDCSCEYHGRQLSMPVRNQGLVPFEWALMHMQLVPVLNTTTAYLAVKGKLSGPARDEMTHRALGLNPKYVVYLDDDVILEPHALYRMHNAMERDPSIGLITGVVCTREDPTQPMIYQRKGEGSWWGFAIDPNAPPEDIHAAGGGCLIVRADAIRKMSQPYWQDFLGNIDDPHALGASTWGHDVYFISKLREESGMRTCVMGSVLCGHWDVAKQKMYSLPKDSPAYKNYHPAPSGDFKVEVAPPLTPNYVHNQLRLTSSDRRIFLVPKSEQKKRMEVKAALTPFFNQVHVVSVDSHWLAVGEELKDGWDLALTGNSARKD